MNTSIGSAAGPELIRKQAEEIKIKRELYYSKIFDVGLFYMYCFKQLSSM